MARSSIVDAPSASFAVPSQSAFAAGILALRGRRPEDLLRIERSDEGTHHHYRRGFALLRPTIESNARARAGVRARRGRLTLPSGETETACFTLYDVDESGDSWSIVVTGPLRKLTGRERTQFDEAAVNESFLELRIFDEDVAAVDLEIFEPRSSRLPGGTGD